MTEEAQLERFRDHASQPIVWQQTARDYAIAANYLVDWYDVSRVLPEAKRFRFSLGGSAPAMVLYAISVENLLKAIRVATEGLPIANGELSGHFKHHKLVSHADSAGLKRSDAETDLLEHLTDFIEAGRYPVATGPAKASRAWRFDFPKDVELVWALLERLERELWTRRHDVLPPCDFRERRRPAGYGLRE